MNAAEPLVSELRAVLASGPPARLVVLFGSAARKTLRPDSDIDVGWIPADAGIELRDELALQGRLVAAVGRDVDLVRLDRANMLVRWAAAREGVLVFARSDGEYTRFVASAALEHAEIGALVERAARRYRRSVLASQAKRPV